MLFLPSDYRLLPVFGWMGEDGWRPDSAVPLDKSGILLALRTNSDTPTIPPEFSKKRPAFRLRKG